jgi:hypothetical protein
MIDETMKLVAEKVFERKLDEITLPGLNQKENDFTVSMGVLIYPIVKELLEEGETILKFVPFDFYSGRQEAKAVIAVTPKRLIAVVPVKELLGKVNFKDIRYIQYEDIVLNPNKGLAIFNPNDYTLGVKYRKIGTNNLKSYNFFVSAKVAEYLTECKKKSQFTSAPSPLVSTGAPGSSDEAPLQILKRRLAQGEISVEEFERLKKALE